MEYRQCKHYATLEREASKLCDSYLRGNSTERRKLAEKLAVSELNIERYIIETIKYIR